MSNDTPKVIGAPDAIWMTYSVKHSDGIQLFGTWHTSHLDASDVKYVRAHIVDNLLDVLVAAANALNNLNASLGCERADAVFATAREAISKAEAVLND